MKVLHPICEGPQITCAHQNDSLAPKINRVGLINQPFRLGTGGDWVLGVGTGEQEMFYNEQTTIWVGNWGGLGFRGGDWGQGTST